MDDLVKAIESAGSQRERWALIRTLDGVLVMALADLMYTHRVHETMSEAYDTLLWIGL